MKQYNCDVSVTDVFLKWVNKDGTGLQNHYHFETPAWLSYNVAELPVAYWTRKMDGIYLCSNCLGECPRGYNTYIFTKYCPHCGHPMENEDNE